MESGAFFSFAGYLFLLPLRSLPRNLLAEARQYRIENAEPAPRRLPRFS